MIAAKDRPVYGVKRLREEEIEHRMEQLWKLYPTQWRRREPFPLLRFLDVDMPEEFDVWMEVDDELDDGALGETRADKRVIRFPDRVVRGIESGNPDDCFTGAHEIAHMLLHIDQYVTSRQMGLTMQRRRDIPAFRDPEVQADFGAASLLIPRQFAVEFIAHGHVSPGFFEKQLNASRFAYRLRITGLAYKRTKPILADRL